MWVPSSSRYSVLLWKRPRDSDICCDTSRVSPAHPGAVPRRGGAGPAVRGLSRGSLSRAGGDGRDPAHARCACAPPLPTARGRGGRDVTRCQGCVCRPPPFPARGAGAAVTSRDARCSASLPAPLPPRVRRGPLRRHGPLPASAPARASRRAPSLALGRGVTSQAATEERGGGCEGGGARRCIRFPEGASRRRPGAAPGERSVRAPGRTERRFFPYSARPCEPPMGVAPSPTAGSRGPGSLGGGTAPADGLRR